MKVKQLEYLHFSSFTNSEQTHRKQLDWIKMWLL